MSHPTTRVLAVLELLQAHGLLSGAQLAERLGVGRRTVRRYIATLEELGIPITTERGSAGGYQLVAGFKLPPMMFTDEEALALAVGLLAARSLGLAEAAPAVASVQAKLERVMPANLKRRVSAVDETVSLDLAGTGSAVPGADTAALSTLTAAAQSRTRVNLRYRSASPREAGEELTERDFDPYGLAHRRGSWYVVGMCHLRGGLRSFRLDRVQAVRPLATTFTPPADFDALAHLVRGIATLPRAFAVEVLLATDLATARRKIIATQGILEWTGEGVLLRGQADDVRSFALELCRLPFPFTVREPAALREAVAAHARALLAQAGAVEVAVEVAGEG